MKHCFVIPGVLVAVAILALLCSLPVYFLWNWLMPEIFGLKTITWLQALGLCVLGRGLFGSSASSSKSS